ncbi:MAG: metallophosphoesterase [Bifidobacteriaceae bacterium]|nr:metallophosphoesterase [Bifidobacteriaceae bacterium]
MTHWLAYGLLVAVPCLFAGVATARTEYSFGPHEALYEVTVDSHLTIDLGPLGAAVLPSPLPGPLNLFGLRVAVGPIPADLATDVVDTQALAADLTEYGQAYMGVGTTLEGAAKRLVGDAAIRAGGYWTGVMVVTIFALMLAGRSRRNQVGMWAARHRWQAAVSGVAVVAVGLVGTGWLISLQRENLSVTPVALLDDTPLEGAHLTGRLGQLAADYGDVFLNAYRDNVRFYEEASKNVEAVFAEQRAEAAERAEYEPRSGAEADAAASATPGEPSASASANASEGAAARPSADPSGDPSGDPSADPSADPSTSPSAGPDRPWEHGKDPYGGLEPVVVYSDLHCNVGMGQVVGAAAIGSRTKLVLDAGDTTMDGTAVERYCIDTLAQSLPAGIDWVVATGNHDTDLTKDQLRGAGARVLDGHIINARGFRILGDADAEHTEVGVGGGLVGDEDQGQIAQRLADTACDATSKVDLLLIHDPAVAQTALEEGCVPLAVSGHIHNRIDPHLVGAGVGYVASSTGRDINETTTIGPLASPAEITVLLFDSHHRLVAWQLLTVNPDASAELSPIYPAPLLPS